MGCSTCMSRSGEGGGGEGGGGGEDDQIEYDVKLNRGSPATAATKGEQFDVKSLREGDDLNPCFVAFDILMLNGKVLTQAPLSERIRHLQSLFRSEVEGRCMLAERSTVSNQEDVVGFLNKAVEKREEGVVVKRPDSTYRLNVRSNEGGWLKLKPDYVSSMMDDLDLVIVGGYFGEGRRGNLMSHFLLALAIPSEGGGPVARYRTVCKVGSGYRMHELFKLNEELSKNRLLKTNKVPAWLQAASEKPDVYIEPQNSKIIQIRAAEIIASDCYAAKVTLRFPRVVKIRDDKSPQDATTTKELDDILEISKGKLAQAYNASNDAGLPLPPAAKKRRGGATVQKIVPERLRQANLKGVERVSNAFGGKEFLILSGTEEMGKHEMEKKIHGLGGTLTQNPGPQTFCVVCEKMSLKTRNMAPKAGKRGYDIAKADWMVRCIEAKTIIPWSPSDLWICTKATKDSLAEEFDEFGDSYTQPLDRDQLKALLKTMAEQTTVGQKRSWDERMEVLRDTFPNFKYGLFWGLKFYIDRYLALEDKETVIEDSSLELLELQLRVFGGTISDILEEATHVIIHPSDLSRLTALKALNAERRTQKLHLVSAQWGKDCMQTGKLCEERNYYPTS